MKEVKQTENGGRKMTLEEKIKHYRKQAGLSQEKMAEKIGVSRQAITKWENGQSVPDLNRILEMARIFGVTTDYLLKDEIEEAENVDGFKSTESSKKLRKVTMEEADEFLRIKTKTSPIIAFGVSLCVASAAPLIALIGLSESRRIGITEDFASGIGVAILLVMVAVAVFLFILSGRESSKYEFLGKEEIETEYGVDGIVREKKNGFSGKFTISVGIGVVLCILSCVPLMLCAGINAKDDIVVISVSILLLIVAVAVNLFVRVGIINSSFDVLLQEGDYTVKKKKEAPVVGAVMLVYWLIFVAIYLGWSFPTGKWDISWVVWPIAGVLSPIVALITRMFVNKKEK